MILCAGKTEQFSFAKPIGVGLVEASIGATLLANKTKEALIFIGTAGSYSEEFAKIGSIHFVNCATQYELRGESVFEQKITANIPSYVSRETNKIVCNSSSYITINKSDAQEFLKKGTHIENMELFSVFSVANRFNLPAIGILYITNICNQSARQDYIKNLPYAMKELENAVNF